MESALLSGYVKMRKGYYRLAVNSRRLVSFLENNCKPKVVIKQPEEGIFEIKRDTDGNNIHLHKKEFITYLRKGILTQNQAKFFSIQSKKSFPTLIRIFPDDFGLRFFDLLPDNDAGELGKELCEHGIKFDERINTPFTSKFDLDFSYEGKEFTVEITRNNPSERNFLNYKHQPKGGVLRAHIFDSYRRCTSSLLNHDKKVHSFVVMSDKWRKFGHIEELIDECSDIGCHLIFANFANKDTFKTISEEIMNIIRR
ncbi:MAG: hypothetical protein GOV02_02685 [Candidatus Aenigmarchaeota archaeon]|nr:hypothetical protein [Candidatus Aenigmarchaeota archaeon]